MSRPRILVPLVGIAASLALTPLVGAVALAADPIVVVQPGDTLTGISKRQGVPIRELVELNGISDPNRIYVGQRLRTNVEEGGPAAPTPATAQPAAAASAVKAKTHVVRAGENLTWIARRYGVTVSALVTANAIRDASRIYAGQRLTIPGSATGTAAAPAASAKAPAMPAAMAELVAKRGAVRQIIVEEATRYGVPVALALAVAWQESGWQPGVVSHVGAVGVMQLMPATAAWVGEAMLKAPVDMRDTRQNVRAGVRLLRHYLDRYAGSRDKVLAAYYQGQWATDHHGIYAVSRPYIASIKVLEAIFGG